MPHGIPPQGGTTSNSRWKGRWATAISSNVFATWRPGSNSCGSMRRSIPTWKWRRSSGGCSAPAGRPCSSPVPRIAASPCWQTSSARWSGCGISSAIRWMRLRRLVKLQVDPADLLRRPRLCRRRPGRPGMRGRKRVRRGPGAGMPDHDRPAAAIEVLARRRRRLHHAAAGLYRRPRPAGACAFEPGHVPRAASGGQCYEPNREVGLHYQIHRGIGAHHAAALRRNEPLRVNVFVGGPPAMTVAAVMPLPEGISELAFAGVLGGRRVPMIAAARRAADPCRGRFLHQRLHRSRAATARGPLRRSPGLLQPGARFSRDASSSTSIIAATRSGRSPSSAGRRRKTRCSAVDSRVGRAGDSAVRSRACRRSTPSMRPACIRCCWPSAASATCPTTGRARPRELLTAGQRPAWARGSCRWPSIC